MNCVFSHSAPELTGTGDVWLSFEGRDSERLPPWFSFEGLDPQAALDPLPSSTVAWLRDLEREALAIVQDAGWRGGGLSVCFESHERVVKGRGYWVYFK